MTESWDVTSFEADGRHPPGGPDDAEQARQEEADKELRREVYNALKKEKVTQIQNEIKTLKGRPQTPDVAHRLQKLRCLRRRSLDYPMDCIYLKENRLLGVFKIGKTGNLKARTYGHQRELPGFEKRARFHTPLAGRVLEHARQNYFRHRQVPPRVAQELCGLPRKARELFYLSQAEADGFEVVAKAVERHLLAIEALRLKALNPPAEVRGAAPARIEE